MTEERSNPENDPLVSRVYREAAAEKAPPALDDAVLREARQAVSANGWLRYARTIHWLRPMAWAATIGLSLAIVLELTMPPPMDSQAILESAPAAPAATPAERIDVPAGQPEPAGRTIIPASADASPRRRQEMEITVADDANAPQQLKAADAPAIASDEAVKEELQRMMQFEQQAEARSVADRPAAAEGVAPMEPSAAFAIAVPCSEEETDAPETWLECIERLNEQGRYVDAKRERERLAEAFPDFDLPALAN